MTDICENCVNPTDSGICADCSELGLSPTNYAENMKIRFQHEFKAFLQSRRGKRILFAFSGGLDSVVTLCKLKGLCDENSITIDIITLDHGYKGQQTADNIANVVNFLGLESSHKTRVITEESLCQNGNPSLGAETVRTTYARKYFEKLLPCGKLCNKIMEKFYIEELRKHGESILITGGDTPKKNAKGQFSIFWRKPEFTILRAACGLALTKQNNYEFVLEHEVPWAYPGCGGYDTDCLLPGAILRSRTNGQSTSSYLRTLSDFPIIIEYFAERVRWGIITRSAALESIAQIDIGSESCQKELEKALPKPQS